MLHRITPAYIPFHHHITLHWPLLLDIADLYLHLAIRDLRNTADVHSNIEILQGIMKIT